MLKLYRVERPASGEFGFPVTSKEALAQVRDRLVRLDAGDELAIRSVLYELNPETPPTTHTDPILKVWRKTVVKFPAIGHLGVFFCKDEGFVSQHAAGVTLAESGNAIDWAASRKARSAGKVRSYLQPVAEFSVEMAERFHDGDRANGLPIAQVIWRDNIWEPESGWQHYSGRLHAAHVHISGFPMIFTRPCLD
jgi:hypothetical protein